MRLLAFLFPIALFFIFLCIKLALPDAYKSLINEDGFLEDTQALVYFSSSVIAFIITRIFFSNRMWVLSTLYGILAIGLLFICFEEISWAQRIFDIENSVFFETNNVQKEISIHNLDTVQPLLHDIYMLIGAYGALAWLFKPALQGNAGRIVNFVVPDWFVSPYFFFVGLIYVLFEFYPPQPGGFLVWRDQEPAELMLSLGFLVFVFSKFVKLRSHDGGAKQP